MVDHTIHNDTLMGERFDYQLAKSFAEFQQSAVVTSSGVQVVTTDLKPKPSFRPAGKVSWATHLLETPQFAQASSRVRGVKKAGINYESSVKAGLLKLFPDGFVPGPWFHFASGHKTRYCQPDGLVIDFRRGIIVIVEIKLTYTIDAWWQIRHLYQPVLEAWLGSDWQFIPLNIVKKFREGKMPPERISVIRSPQALVKENFNILLW